MIAVTGNSSVANEECSKLVWIQFKVVIYLSISGIDSYQFLASVEAIERKEIAYSIICQHRRRKRKETIFLLSTSIIDISN